MANIKVLVCVLHIRIHKFHHVLGCFILDEAAWAWSGPPTPRSAKIRVELYLPPCICLAQGQLYLYHISAQFTHMCMGVSVDLFQLNLCLYLWHYFLSFCGISQNYNMIFWHSVHLEEWLHNLIFYTIKLLCSY